jgi:hypothetical protein
MMKKYEGVQIERKKEDGGGEEDVGGEGEITERVKEKKDDKKTDRK